MNISDFRKDLLSKSFTANLTNNVKQNINHLQEQLALQNFIVSNYVLTEANRQISGTNITTDEFKQMHGIDYDERKNHASLAQEMSDIKTRAEGMTNKPTADVVRTFNQKSQEVKNTPEGQWTPETTAAFNDMLAASQTVISRQRSGEHIPIGYGTQDVNKDKGLAPNVVNFSSAKVDPSTGAFTPSSGGPAISSGKAGDAEIENRMRQIARGSGLFGKGIENTQQTPEYYELRSELLRRRGAAQTQSSQPMSRTNSTAPRREPSAVPAVTPSRPAPRREPSAVPTAQEVKKTQTVADRTGLPTALPTHVAPGTMNITDMDGNPIAVQPSKKAPSAREFNQQAAINQQAMEKDVDVEGDYLYDKGGYAQSPVNWKDRYPSAYTNKPVRLPSRTPQTFSMFDEPKRYNPPSEVSYVSAISNDIPGMPSLKIPAPGTQDYQKSKIRVPTELLPEPSLNDVISTIIKKGYETYGMPKQVELPIDRKIGGADPDIQRGQYVTPEDQASPYKREGNKIFMKNKEGKWVHSHTLDSKTGKYIQVK